MQAQLAPTFEIKLRDLPGVMQVEAMCRARVPFDPPHESETFRRIDEKSISLFGITLDDTIYDEDDWDYEQRFSATWALWEQAQTYWEAIGWDLTDGKGQPLRCHWCFERQIIACMFNLVKGTVFTPDGSGRWAGETNDELEARRLEAWKEELERQAQRFLQDNFRGRPLG